ncbi:MAG: hypothetical protein NC548_11320 [Lachnospiraceae bacterium]|nr:hypothetical protein [Lachnospiraceae bacterium]
MGDWAGFFYSAVIVLVAAIFIKSSKKVLTTIAIIALIAWLVIYGIPAIT